MTISATRPTDVIRPQGLGYVEFTDMFCGAGGSSLGLHHVPGILVTQCINHDKLAIEAHNLNFPDADHDYQDIWKTPAARFRRTAGLWASPSCTHHAFCRGVRSDSEDADKSRATMWCVCRFTEYHRYDAVIVENVVEARLWCDDESHDTIRPDGTIKKCNCGSTFDLWYRRMLDMGYEGQIVYFNSQFALPTPQSRDRMYVVFWRRGIRRPELDFRPPSWCSACERVVAGVRTMKKASRGSLRTRPGLHEWGRYGAQYFYSCPDCKAMVAPAVVGSKSIINFDDLGVQIGRRKELGMPELKPKTRKRIRVGMINLQTTEPITVQVGGNLFERKGYARVWSVDSPLRTITTTNYMSLVVPAKTGSVPRSDDEPSPTVTARTHLGVVVRAGGQNGKGRTLEEPMGSVIGSDRQVAVVIPNREHSIGRSDVEPLQAVTTAPAQHMLVQKTGVVEFRRIGNARSIERPVHTVTGGGNNHGLLVYNGTPGYVSELDVPSGTVTARDKQSLLVPYFGSAEAAYTTLRPMGALTGKDRSALVITEDDIDACWFRMLKWPELLKAQYMHQMPDGSPYQLEAKRKNARGRWVSLSDEMRVKYIGNAVSSPVAALLGAAVVEALR